MVALSWKEPLVALSPEEVGKLAELARIELSAEDLERLAPQVAAILEVVVEVSGVDTSEVLPMSHPTPQVNVFRDDVTKPSLGVAVALASAPDVESDRFRVPRILGEDQ